MPSRNMHVVYVGKSFPPRWEKVDEPFNHPESINFIIRVPMGDWSGYRTLPECLEQTSMLEPYKDDYFTIEEWSPQNGN